MTTIASLLQHPDKALLDAKIFLSGPTGCVGLVSAEGRKIVIKEHKMRTLLKGLKYLFLPSRACRSFKNAQLLAQCGIPTPVPIGYVEKRFSFFKKHSYYLYEYVEGVDLFSLLKREGRVSCEVVESCVALIRRLKEEEIAFGDMKSSNFVITPAGAVLIDIHPLKQKPFRFREVQRRNVARFLYSIRNHGETKEAFIACFNQQGMKIDEGMLKMVFSEW